MVIRLAKFIKPYLAYLVLALLGALGETAAGLLEPWPLKILFDNIFGGQPLSPAISEWVLVIFGQGATGILYFVLATVFGIALLGAVSTFMQDFFMPRVGHWILHDLRRKVYWHIQRLSMGFHDEARVGELLNTLTTDIQAVRELIESALIGLIVNTLMLLGMVVIMLAIEWRFALIALSITPFLFVTIYRFIRRIKQASRDARRREGLVTSVAQEVLTSMRAVQAFTREDYEQARFERENEQRVKAGIRARTLQAQLKPSIELLVAMGTLLVLWYGTGQVLAGALLPGSLLVFVFYITRLYKPMKEFSKQADILSRAGVGLERIAGILETGQQVKDLPGAKPAPRFQGTIQFENVFFSYRAGEPVLKDICLTVEPGQVIALVGATGAGKTTLIRLIPRFNDPDHGRIRIDGRDIRSHTLASLRAQISLVLQESILFYGTVRENIAYGRPEATPDEVVAAATMANAHRFIEKLPQGYDTMIGQRGAVLSGGQRQLVTIARAVIRGAPIILLDEPTTGLDASTEALVMEGLARLIKGRTVLVIAHRLATVSRADSILVLERGEVVERGTHEKLLELGGRYAQLYELQFRGQTSVEGGQTRPRYRERGTALSEH